MSPADIVSYVISHLDDRELRSEISLLGHSAADQASLAKSARDPSLWDVSPDEPMERAMTLHGTVEIPKGAIYHRVYLEDGVYDQLYAEVYLVNDQVIYMYLSAS